VIIDEVQRLPQLFELLRPLCDSPTRRANFLLLGSASPTIVRGVSESLAGRVLFVRLSGLSLSEVGPENQDRLWLRGGFPLAYLAADDTEANEWLGAFRETFLQQDIPALGLGLATAALGRFWTMLAHYHGQTWNASEIAQAMGSGFATVTRYRDILEGTFMLRVLQPWYENIGKRQTRSPKVYLRDSGILHQSLRIETMLDLRSDPRYGASWEGFGIEQCLTRFGADDAYFWSTQRGAELDLLLFRRGKRWGFEFKCADAPSTTKSMHIAMNDLGLEHLWVIYPGTRKYALNERMTALPLHDLPSLELT
jgi:predicted AAA+ superfamily ATPase